MSDPSTTSRPDYTQTGPVSYDEPTTRPYVDSAPAPAVDTTGLSLAQIRGHACRYCGTYLSAEIAERGYGVVTPLTAVRFMPAGWINHPEGSTLFRCEPDCRGTTPPSSVVLPGPDAPDAPGWAHVLPFVPDPDATNGPDEPDEVCGCKEPCSMGPSCPGWLLSAAGAIEAEPATRPVLVRPAAPAAALPELAQGVMHVAEFLADLAVVVEAPGMSAAGRARTLVLMADSAADELTALINAAGGAA